LALLVPALLVLAIGPATVSANNDPHRFFLPAGPMTVPAEWCGYPINLDFPTNREYGRSTLADGSSVLAVTGSFFVKATANGKTLLFNASGPGTYTFSADGTLMTASLFGRSFLWAPNLKEFGFPSNVVSTSGPMVLTQLTADAPAFLDISGHPQVVTDVCAALS
jgi:hypothetical protein